MFFVSIWSYPSSTSILCMRSAKTLATMCIPKPALLADAIRTKILYANLVAYTEAHFKRKIKLNLSYYIYCFIHCNAILSKIKTLVYENESWTSSANHSFSIITRLCECLSEPLNGTMISARPCIWIFKLHSWIILRGKCGSVYFKRLNRQGSP